MTNVDQFESVFRAAEKPVYTHNTLTLRRALVVTDLPRDQAARFAERVGNFLSDAGEAIPLTVLAGEDFQGTGELLQRVATDKPSLVCAYRNLHSADFQRVHSLGEHLDVLTQVATAPVLVLPNPRIEDGTEGDANQRWDEVGTASVMVVTDHLGGDNRLIDWAVRFCAEEGELLLAHIEDDGVFERFMTVIGKLPAIDTDVARTAIRAQLLKEPRDYIASIERALTRGNVGVAVRPLVSMGHRLADYKRLVQQHAAGLVVLNTRDDDQLAMHGLAYPLAVELRGVPMLML